MVPFSLGDKELVRPSGGLCVLIKIRETKAERTSEGWQSPEELYEDRDPQGTSLISLLILFCLVLAWCSS